MIRLNDGGFSDAQWSLFDIPGSVLRTNNSVYGDENIGFAIDPSTDGTIASSYAGLLS